MKEKFNKIIFSMFVLFFSFNVFSVEKTKSRMLENKPKIIYLTFDDGPSVNTDKVLEILKKNDIKATFFVIGQNQDKYKKIVDEGHTIALHTYTHDYKKIYASESAFFEDLYKIRDAVKAKTGIDSKIIRFAGGSSNHKASKILKTNIIKRLTREGFVYHDWNCDSTDASGNRVPVAKLVANATACNAREINLLMHDSASKKTTVEALQKIIDYYRAKGYEFEKITMSSFKAQHFKIK